MFQSCAGIVQLPFLIFQQIAVTFQRSCAMFQCRRATFQPGFAMLQQFAGTFQRIVTTLQQTGASFQPVGQRDFENSGDYRLHGRSRHILFFVLHVLASRLRYDSSQLFVRPSVRPEVAGIVANHRRSVNLKKTGLHHVSSNRWPVR